MNKIILALFLSILLLPAAALADGPKADVVSEKTRYGEISYPQLSGLADKNIEKSINAVIREEAKNEWHCDFDGERESVEGLSYDAHTTVRLIDADYFSYTVSKDYFCGGAHPVQQIDAHNFSLKDGSPMPIQALLKGGYEENLTRYLIENHKFADKGCKDAYAGIDWDYYRTSDNIVFLPRLPGNSNPCFEEFPVSIKTFAPHLQEPVEEDRD